MNRMLCFVFIVLTLITVNRAGSTDLARYYGMSDASAAVAVDSQKFIVSNDEDNRLRLYQIDQLVKPIKSFDLTSFLNIIIDKENPEADIEAASRSGKRIYWIASHGRNKEGLFRPNRYRFFATDVENTNNGIELAPIGRPCITLLEEMIQDPHMACLGLAEAAAFGAQKVKKLAPDEDGINIEGMSVTADGKSLLIGFRNPRPENKALVVMLENPDAVLVNGAKPVFAQPILLDLDGLGIRSMEYAPWLSAFLIVAGEYNDGHKFILFKWSGNRHDSPEQVQQLTDLCKTTKFRPEAIIVYPEGKSIQLLSDDGELRVNYAAKKKKERGPRNKDLKEPEKRSFRSLWLD
jgi:hypothetical protein